jgi:hypothetical protein
MRTGASVSSSGKLTLAAPSFAAATSVATARPIARYSAFSRWRGLGTSSTKAGSNSRP